MAGESMDPAVHLAIGQRFARRREFEEAELSFQRALDPEIPMAHNNLGGYASFAATPTRPSSVIDER